MFKISISVYSNSSKSVHWFWRENVTNRQTDKVTFEYIMLVRILLMCTVPDMYRTHNTHVVVFLYTSV